MYVAAGNSRGYSEYVTVSRVGCFTGGWQAGERREESGALRIPAIVPVSFTGQLLRVTWHLCVVHECPGMQAQRQYIEVTVLPMSSAI